MEKYILQLGELSWGKVMALGLIAAVLYWAGPYDNGEAMETQIKALGTQLETSEKQLRETKEAMSDAEKFEKAVRQNEGQFDKVLDYLPQAINTNELTRLVNEQAQLSGARVMETKPQDAIERKDFYEMTRLNFKVQGTFQQVVLFMSSLSKIQKLLTFDNIKIKTSTDGGVSNSESPRVELEGVLTGYRYVKDTDLKNGKPGEGAAGAKK